MEEGMGKGKREKGGLLVLLTRFVFQFNDLNNYYLKAQNKQKKQHQN